MKKKLVAVLLAVLLSFGLISCEKEAPATTGAAAPTEEKSTKEESTEETVDEADLTYDVISWIGFSEKGTLEVVGDQEVYHIKSAADLDPFREHLHNMTEEEEKNLFLDPRDHVLLIEIVSSTEKSAYGVEAIYWEGGVVNVEIYEEVTDEITPSHTFILFHMPFSLVGNADVNMSVFLS